MHIHSSDLRALRDTGFYPENYDIIQHRLRCIFHDDRLVASIVPLLDFLLRDLDINASSMQFDFIDALYLQSLSNIRNWTVRVDGGRRVVHRRTILTSSQLYDFLADHDVEWNLLKTLNYLAMGAIKPTRKLAVLATVRNEGINLIEWIAHYRTLGADSIFIYMNDNDDGSEGLLRLLSELGVITLIENDTAITSWAIQMKVFNHALLFVPELWDHEWFFFADLDEFFVPGAGVRSFAGLTDDIDGFFSQAPVSGVSFNWAWFGSDAEARRRPGLVTEKFCHSTPSAAFKTIARIRDVTGIRTAHLPRLIAGGVLADGNFNLLDDPADEIGPAFGRGQVNHYWNKSFEEFVAKSARGSKIGGERDYSLFFKWGNMDKGEHDPIPDWLIEGVRREVSFLLELPHVQGIVQGIEDSFAAFVSAVDREIDIGKLYEEGLAASRTAG